MVVTTTQDHTEFLRRFVDLCSIYKGVPSELVAWVANKIAGIYESPYEGRCYLRFGCVHCGGNREREISLNTFQLIDGESRCYRCVDKEDEMIFIEWC